MEESWAYPPTISGASMATSRRIKASVFQILSSTPDWDALTPEQMAQVEIIAAEIPNTKVFERNLREHGLSIFEIQRRILQCVLLIADYRVKGDQDSFTKGEILKFILIKGRRPGEQA